MNAKSVVKMGFLSMIAVTGLFEATNGFASGARTTSNSEGMKAKAVSDDGKTPETLAPQRQVVDSNGKVYLLTSLQTKDGKACGEYLHEYIPRIGA